MQAILLTLCIASVILSALCIAFPPGLMFTAVVASIIFIASLELANAWHTEVEGRLL